MDISKQKPDIAICYDCKGKFKVVDLETVYDHHNGHELPAFGIHLCPVCPDGGNIDDYEFSK